MAYLVDLLKQKPLDIEEPEIVEESNIKDMIAFMLMGSSQSKEIPYGLETDKLLKYPSTGDLNSNIMESIRMEEGEKLQCGLGPRHSPICLNPKAVRRWTRAGQAINNLDPESEFAIKADDEKGVKVKACKGLRLDDTSLPDQWHEISRDKSFKTFTIFTDSFDNGFAQVDGVLLSLIYDGVHLTAWYYSFVTRSEQLLWRISGIIVMAQFLLQWWSGTCIFGFLIFMRPAMILCIFVRVFLVIESFISLRHAPLGVYTAVPWVQSIPHIWLLSHLCWFFWHPSSESLPLGFHSHKTPAYGFHTETWNLRRHFKREQRKFSCIKESIKKGSRQSRTIRKIKTIFSLLMDSI